MNCRFLLFFTGTRYNSKIVMRRNRHPARNSPYIKAVISIEASVYGGSPFVVCEDIKMRKMTGGMVYETKTTTIIPRIDINDIDCKAGCCAKIKAPIPTIMVKAEKKMAVLCPFSAGLFVRYLFCKPSIINILKSSPIPNMKVDRMILMILNSIPDIPMMPIMIIQLINIGEKLISVNSIRP